MANTGALSPRFAHTGGLQAAVHPFDLEEESEASRLLNPRLEKEARSGVGRDTEVWWQTRTFIVGASAIASILLLAGLLLGLILGIRNSRHREEAYVCPDVAAASNYKATFFIVGDWGRGANYNQQIVAKMMGKLGQCYRPEFVISTGDNFYMNGLKAIDDPHFTKTFTEVYSAPTLQVPWYAVLGNHDYGELDRKQLSTCSAPTLEKCPPGCCYSALWQTQMQHRDRRWHLKQGAWRESYLGGLLDIVYIDTTPLVGKYRDEAWANTPGGVATQNASEQIEAITSLLGTSDAKWKLVVGHHPVRSYGDHCKGGRSPGAGGDCVDMAFLSPLMNKYQVAAYFCGHEHDMQLIKQKPGMGEDQVVYVVSGAGSDVRTGEFTKTMVLATEDDYLADTQGFVAAAISPAGDTLDLHMWVKHDLLKPAYTITLARDTA